MPSALTTSDAMSAIQPPDEAQQSGQEAEPGAEVSPADAAPATGDARGRTWPHGMPAMRVQHARWRSGRPAVAVDSLGAEAMDGAPRTAAPRFPPSMWLIRAVVGVILLALAWIGALAIYLLAGATLAPLPRQQLVMALPVRVVEGLGTCLMVVVVVTLLLVGAFALSLVVRPNDPLLAPAPPPHPGSASSRGEPASAAEGEEPPDQR